MKLEKLKNPVVLAFAVGAAVVPAIKKIAKCDKTRKAAVTGLAKGMKLYDDAKAALKNIKEDAEDLCYEAKQTLEKEEAADIDEI